MLKRGLALLGAVAASACAPQSEPVVLRLADVFQAEHVQNRVETPALPPPTEWRFDTATHNSPIDGWSAASGVAGLEVRDGRLSGQSKDALPLLHVERRSGLEDVDVLHSVEVRARVGAGANLGIAFRSEEKLDVPALVKRLKERPWALISTPLVPGDDVQTYTLRSPYPVRSADARHVVLRPTDASGARFEIERVRLVFRKEHLAAIPSGLGWQGLSEVYAETLVARAPETIRIPVQLPRRARLDLRLGTIEDAPVTFRVAVERTKARGPKTSLLERTLTTAHRWEDVRLELEAFAGEQVQLELSLHAERPGALGFWGNPVVRRLGARPAGREGPQGVILLWVDTLRRDHLGVYGHARATSPAIDRFASEGTLFRDCVTQASWTKASTPSLMTSLYPTSHGVKDFLDRLPASATTLAELYREAGYATLSLSSVLFVGQLTNLHQGFEVLHEDGSLPDTQSSKTARPYLDRLLPWLEEHRELPFFVLLHVGDPHDPYRPEPPYDGLFADPAQHEEHERHAKQVREFIADPLLRDFGMPTRQELARAGLDPESYVAHDRDWYDGSIRGLDAEIARLLERLRELGLDERTLVVLTADHGEEFLEHGRMFHGQSTYGELTNVPLVLRGPGVPRGAVVEGTVATIDIMPTLLELSGIAAPAGIQGRSLVSRMRGRSTRDVAARPVVSEKAATNSAGGPPPRETESAALIAEGWKLVHNTRPAAGQPEYELYDHVADPLNLNNLAAEQPERVERLARELAAWKKRAAEDRLKPDADAERALSQEELERLRSLGYIQ